MKKYVSIMLLVVLLAIGTILTPIQAFAASTDPYCRISFDATYNCNTVKYYSYNKDGVAKFDSSRLVLFDAGKLELSAKRVLVSKKHLSSTVPSWTTDGKYLIWVEESGNCYARKYGDDTNKKLADKVAKLTLNAESMVVSAEYSNGNTDKIGDLLAGKGNGPGNSGNSNGSSDSGNSGNNNSGNNGNSGSSDSNSGNSETEKVSKVAEYTDSAGCEHFTFGSHEIIVDGKNVYLDSYKISEVCNSGVRFVGVDSSSRVYLYEDASSSLYRFITSNMFFPDKIRFVSGTIIEKVNTDANGILTGVETSDGIYSVAQLATDRQWYPAHTYSVNKKNYSTLYVAESTKKYTLTLKDKKLFLGSKQVASGISRPTESFGFSGKYIYCLKGTKAYRAKRTSPKKWKVWKKNVKKLTYSSKTGLVSGATK